LSGAAKTQSGGHIKPLHFHCSTRLILEGGFPPEWLLPRPGLAAIGRNNLEYTLQPDPKAQNDSEYSVLGGIKHKSVDVTVMVPGIGPALGISAKSTGNAFRNLTNRMEEALGDCANIHMMYPGFVFGFLHVLKHATLSAVGPADASFDDHGQPLDRIKRYHDVLISLSGRTTVTDPAMRYESVGLVVYQKHEGKVRIVHDFPPKDSPVHYASFFQRLYTAYDLRYAYPDSSGRSHRKAWTIKNLTIPARFDEETGFPWEARRDDGS
jgi:hypothetical protein